MRADALDERRRVTAQHVGLGRGLALDEREPLVQHLDPRLRLRVAPGRMQDGEEPDGLRSPRMRTRVAVLVVLAIAVAGCGGGAKKTSFTNANWDQLEFNAQTGEVQRLPGRLRRPGLPRRLERARRGLVAWSTRTTSTSTSGRSSKYSNPRLQDRREQFRPRRRRRRPDHRNARHDHVGRGADRRRKQGDRRSAAVWLSAHSRR